MSRASRRIQTDVQSRPQTEIDPRPSRRAELSRRRLFQAAGVIGLSLWADQHYTNEHWPDSQTGIFMLSNRTKQPNPNGWLVVPGYGSIHGMHMAHQVRANKGIPESAPIGAFVYGNSEVRLSDLNRKAQRFVTSQHLQSLSLVLHSMGGPVGLNAARHIGKPLHDVMLLGSPFDIDDACAGILARGAAAASEATGYDGSIASKYVGALYNRFSRHGCDGVISFFDDIYEAGIDTWDGASPKTLGSQLCILRDNPLGPHVVDHIAVQGVTRAAYCMPHIPTADTTVHDVQAAHKYDAMFARHGIALDRIYLPHLAHADVGDAMAHTTQWLSERSLAHHHPAP